MLTKRQIWRSRLWAKHGDIRIIIHVVADANSVGYKVVSVPKSGRPATIALGTAPSVPAANIVAEKLAKQSELVGL